MHFRFSVLMLLAVLQQMQLAFSNCLIVVQGPQKRRTELWERTVESFLLLVLMEMKQLNLNAPLLSVRKPTSNSSLLDVKTKKFSAKSGPIRQHSLPLPKSEWELSVVTKPVAVPFQWEQIPGKAKGEYEDQTETPKRSESAPRLPPGRLPDTVKRYSGERCSDPKIVRNYSVERCNDPKILRHYSGERCNDPKILRYYSGERCNDQKFLRHYSGERCNDQKNCMPQSQVYPFMDHAALIASLKESINVNEESDLESVDDAYSDAVDTLSPTASFSFNCSVSGLSGLELPNMRQSGTFCTDPQTRDFMMSRFLPAAKAAVVETPKYIPKKQTMVTEQPKQPRKVVSGERKPLLAQFETDILSYYNDYAEDVQSEVEDSQCNDPKKGSSKAWGIFPRLCVKKSLCLFNPVPAIRTRTQIPKSPPTDIRRLSRKAYSGPLDKQTWDANNKRIFHSGVLTREMHRVENQQSETKQFANASYKAGGLSPCRPFRSGEISPYRNATPQSPFRKGARFLGIPKEADSVTAEKYNSLYKKCSNLLDAAPPRISRREAVSPNEAVEKTLHVDSVTTVNLIKHSASSKAESHVNSTGDQNSKVLAECKRMEENSPANCGNQEVKPLDVKKEGTKLDPKSSILVRQVLPSSACISKARILADRTEHLQLNKSLTEETRSFDIENASDAQKDASDFTLQSPLAPPLPKSPSESWLWRTLPSIHLRIPFSHLQHGKNFHAKKVDQKASTPAIKWETIVKTSNLYDHHSRNSEEHFPHVSRKQNKV